MPASSENVSQSGSVRFGLVGCGRIALSHLEALSALSDVTLSAVVEPREAAGQAVAEQYHTRWFSTHENPDVSGLVDAVIVCCPPVYHFEVAKHFLGQGIHVLCEKPLTISSEHAEELVELSEKHRVVLMMASKFRYVDDVVRAKSIVESAVLGDIILYENTFCSRVTMRDRWNSDRAIAGGGVLIDNGSHSVDIARYLLGPVKEVQAVNALSSQGLDVEETVCLQFKTESEVNGTVFLSWSINRESDFYISLFGTQGTVLVGWKGSRFRQEGNSNWVSFGSGYDKVEAFRNQLRNFVDAIRGEEMPLITPEDALASVKVIETAYASESRSNWLRVDSLKPVASGVQAATD